ncbi:flavin-containing monooxygenase [uncultured Sphingomonas sp.]|uniref:flavin-containing monooxygenase n=1 Tax=uncultured Sphingomonas sp. TaxID=158754 RepID=UPI0035CA7891
MTGDRAIERVDAVCIVGAGPHGLIAARALKKSEVPFVILEKHDDVGGLWDIANPGTPMYESCHFVSSRNGSSYFDFAMPDSYPDYPSRLQILAHIRRFADRYGLREHVEFDSKVVRAEPDGERWIVETEAGRVRSFEALIVCPGCTWHPRLPDFEGHFDGELLHSVAYKNARQLTGKNVLIVGMGNSGADIACDAVRTAAGVFVSMRRGYNFVPKHLFGIPTLDLLNDPTLAPEALRGIDFPAAVQLHIGDITRLGFPRPDHAVGETHPVMNTQVLYHAAHGRIVAKPDVERLDGDTVRFIDGSAERIDTIIAATGYDYRVPFIDEAAFGWEDGHPRLYLTAFSRQHPTLFVIGLIEANGAPWKLDDQLSLIIAEYLADRRAGRPRAAALRERVTAEQVDLQAGHRFVASARTVNYVNVPDYEANLHRIADDFGFSRLRPGFYDSVATAADAREAA